MEVTVPVNIYLGQHPRDQQDPAYGARTQQNGKPERWLSPFASSVTDARVPGVYANM